MHSKRTGLLFHETRRRMELQPLVLINAVGLTGRLLALAPRLQQLGADGLDSAAPAKSSRR